MAKPDLPRPATVPTTATLKAMRRHPWTADLIVHVWIAPERPEDERRFTVWAADGTHLGRVEWHMGTLDTKIKGTRLVRRGMLRKLWTNSEARWSTDTSQAEAIRHLLPTFGQDNAQFAAVEG